MKTEKYTKEEKELIKLFRQSKMDQLNFVVKHLFNGITEEDVIRYNKVTKTYSVGTHQLTDKDLKQLSNEAKSIKDSALWIEMVSSTQLAANKMMYENSKSIEDMYFPKAALWVVDVFKKKLDKLEKL